MAKIINRDGVQEIESADSEVLVRSYGVGGGFKYTHIVHVFHDIITKTNSVIVEKFVDESESPNGRKLSVSENGIDTYLLSGFRDDLLESIKELDKDADAKLKAVRKKLFDNKTL